MVFNRFKWFKIKCLATCLMNLKRIKLFYRNKRFQDLKNLQVKAEAYLEPKGTSKTALLVNIVNGLLLFQ